MSGFFRITARGHNALMLMSELAGKYKSGAFMSLQEVADRLHISQGYLEEVAGALKKSKLIVGKQGPAGGYRLARTPSKISMQDIMVAIEGPIELVACQSKNPLCPVAGKCPSKNAWSVVQKAIKQSLKQTTLDKIL